MSEASANESGATKVQPSASTADSHVAADADVEHHDDAHASRASSESGVDRGWSGSHLIATTVDPKLASDLIQFSIPQPASADDDALAADIVRLDHESQQVFPPGTRPRDQIKNLLRNAVVIGFDMGNAAQGRAILDSARQLFQQRLRVASRLQYLVGALVGMVGSMIASDIGAWFGATMMHWDADRAWRVAWVVAFAGLGSMVSVLSRLGSMDLTDYRDWRIVTIAGAAKPIVGCTLAIPVFLALWARLIDVRVGGDDASSRWTFCLVVAFMCGFAERFAEDLLDSVVAGLGKGSARNADPVAPEKKNP